MRKVLCIRKAAEVMTELGILPPPPVDIGKMVGEWGLAVDYVQRPRGLHGRVMATRAVIEIANNDPPHRQRFTLAHELGHYVLDHNPVFTEAESHEVVDPKQINEREANYFAAVLLMPKEWLREDWRMLRDASRIADLYNVSAEAMWIRLEELSLIKL